MSKIYKGEYIKPIDRYEILIILHVHKIKLYYRNSFSVFSSSKNFPPVGRSILKDGFVMSASLVSTSHLSWANDPEIDSAGGNTLQSAY
jgi:hypothetical protein